jgi:hypothetical protein
MEAIDDETMDEIEEEMEVGEEEQHQLKQL